MIEIIILLIIICAVVGSLRKPRTFAEAEYAEYQREENRRIGQRRAVFLLLAIALAGSIYWLVYSIERMRALQ